MAGERVRILEWWQKSYVGQVAIGERFVDEAIAALLPGTCVFSASPSLEDVFDGLMMQ